MAVRIQRIGGVSGFFRPGDEIVSIGGRPVADQLDVLFLTSGGGSVPVTVRRDSAERTRVLSIRTFERARLSFEPMRFIRCRSRCVFCFMDQMPPGMRASLYEKDDDYRLSFLFGNFITLNDVNEEDIRRIIGLHLSPLYISIHAVDAGVRERIFGRQMKRNILSDLRRLARRGIVVHAQIVLVPGMNDGAALERSLAALWRLYPACRSVAVVPVGITAHRKDLPRIRRMNAAEARRLVSWAADERERYRARTGGERFLHLADELYLLAGRTLPPAEEYDDYPQIANGVGMCRLFLDDLRRDAARLRRRGGRPGRMTIATGGLGARFLRRYASPLLARELPGFDMRLLPVPNRLFGPAVGVSGLLAGRDIIREARRRKVTEGCVVIPPNALNHAGRFLDGLTPAAVGRELRLEVRAARRTFLESRIVRLCGGGASS